ncbi:MAG: hypothetical protein Tp182DCM212571_40 [Prokaryotic dsDNA virus sp.]|nr:MAG: hypothetical protein Tp182DCM212571_40 [Prokaryotic dsDNA virus sp.]
MVAAKPVVLTQSATNPSSFDPEPLVVVGNLPVPAAQVTALTAVPGSFADLAAVRTYLNTLVTELKSSPYFS